MNKNVLAIPLMLTPMMAHAHSSDMPLIVHAIEHGWILLALLPLLFFLLPFGRMRCR